MAFLARFGAALLFALASAADDDAMLQMDPALLEGADEEDLLQTLQMDCDEGEAPEAASLRRGGDDGAMLQLMGNPEFTKNGKLQDDEAVFQMPSEPLELDRDGDL